MSRSATGAPGRRHQRRWALGAVGLSLALVGAAAGIALADPSTSAADEAAAASARGGIALPAAASPASSPTTAAGATTPSTSPTASASAAIQLGAGGFTVYPSNASTWVSNNPDDPRTPVIRDRIAAEPHALWLTGDESYGNLSYVVSQAQREDSTLTLSIYDIPGRDDGLSGPTDVTPAEYRTFIDRVVTTIGDTRAVVVVEPDALWFVDRQTPPGTQEYTDRMSLLNYVVDAFRTKAPRSRVYLEAGTSSNSVTPQRMAQLLQAAGVARADGFAVNVSSFGPDAPITAWAQAIRTNLAASGVADAHYVVDTSRNGNPNWDYTWCNPAGRKIGSLPGVVNAANGLDANIWIKQPGTSDGDCGVGAGTSGGEFMPQVGYDQAR